MRRVFLLFVFTGWLCPRLLAQDTMEIKKEYKNSVRLNITNPLIFGIHSIIFGYERVLKHNRSFSVTAGQASFPTFHLANSDSVKSNKNISETGYHFSGDYRFYLSKENKYDAPHGLYIGPYYSYNYFERKNGWIVKSTSGGADQLVESRTSLSAHVVGAELGWQVILWNRLALDFLLAGPGLGFYSLDSKLGSNLSDADRQKLFEKLNEALAEKFPGYSVAIDEGQFKKEGSSNTTNFGFRYMVMVGYRF